tara:strand:- start:4828 stop:5355 length:528 start_codon:yes stop_codon:yes gene_type:complete
MAASGYSMEIVKGKGLADAFNWSPNLLNKKATAMMQESLALLSRKLRIGSHQLPSGVTGLLRGSIFDDMRGMPVKWHQGVVASPQPYARYIELGRKPGRMPPVEALRLWAARVLGDESLAFPVARMIGRRGYPPGGRKLRYPPFKRTMDDNRQRILNMWKPLLRFVAEDVRRRGR